MLGERTVLQRCKEASPRRAAGRRRWAARNLRKAILNSPEFEGFNWHPTRGPTADERQDLAVLDGRDDQRRAELLAERLQHWKSMTNA